MSRYESASPVFYRLAVSPRRDAEVQYRDNILKGHLAKALYRSIYIYGKMKKCTVAELNVQPDHVHLVVRMPPGFGVSA